MALLTTKKRLKDIIESAMAEGIGGRSDSSSSLLSRVSSLRRSYGGTVATDADPTLEFIPPELKEEQFLKFGDAISIQFLDGDDSVGFLAVEGTVDCDCFLTEEENKITPKNFTDCIFRIEYMNQYSALNNYHKKLRDLGVADISELDRNSEVYKEVLDLKLKMEQEKSLNRIEREKALGNSLVYGQIVQLYHCKSKKYLTIARESATRQKDCMRLMLDPVGFTSSYFYIHPGYSKLRTDGEKVRVGDKVVFLNKKSGQYLHLSHLRYEYENAAASNNKREINISTSVTKWRLNLYAPFQGNDASMYLKAGDVIRLYHREVEGYLTVPHDAQEEVYIHVAKKGEKRDTWARRTNFLWRIEMQDPSVGGIFSFNQVYRLCHLATGRYLAAGTTRIPETPRESAATSSSVPLLTRSRSNSRTSDGAITPRGRSASGNLLRDLRNKKAKQKWNFLRNNIIGIFGNNAEEGGGGGAQDENAAEAPQVCELYTTTEHTNPATYFVIHPLSKKEGFIPVDSFIRFRHKNTNTWVHALPSWLYSTDVNLDDESADNNADINEEDAENIERYFEVNTNASMFEEDVFSVERVQENEVDDLLFVMGVIPTIEAFHTKLKKEYEIHMSDVKSLTGALNALIEFLVGSERHVILDKSVTTRRQLILQEQRVIELVMDILDMPFKLGYITLEIIEKPEYSEFHEMFSLCYNLVTHFVKENKTSGLYLSSYIRAIQSQIGYRLKAEDTLMELFKDNYELLQQITTDQIRFFIDTIDKTGKQPRYITFLSALCNCEGKPVTRNQDIIVELLLEVEAHQKNLLILPYVKEDNKIYVDVSNTKGRKQQELRPEAVQTMELESFAQRYKDLEPFDYFEKTIELLAKLCEGRNKRASIIISKLLSKQLLLQIIKSEKLPPSFRSTFINLFLSLYVDCEPNQRAPQVKYIRKWDAIGTDLAPSEFRELQEYLNEYFTKHSDIEHENVAVNKLTYSMTVLCRDLFEFGLYTNLKTVEGLIQALFGILDGRPKQQQDGGNSHLALVDAYRRSEGINNEIVHKIKIEACKVFNLICDWRLDMRISVFLAYFKRNTDHGAPTNIIARGKAITGAALTMANLNVNQPEAEQLLPDSEEELLKSLFTDLVFSKDGTSIDDILLDLLRYENDDLRSAALQMLFRNNGQKQELQKTLSMIEILVSHEMVSLYDKMHKILGGIRSTVYARMKEPQELHTIKLLDTIIEDLSKNEVQCQRILKNLNAHRVILDTLYILTPALSDVANTKVTTANRNSSTTAATATVSTARNESENRRKILMRCYTVLQKFVRNNASNQKLVFPYMGYLLTQIAEDCGAIEAISEIVRDNRNLCSSVEEKHIRYIVNVIADKAKYAKFLNFLKLLIIVNGKAHKGNQTIVLKALMDREKDVLVLFKDSDGMKQREKLMKNKDFEKNGEKSLLLYHVTLIELLAACADGKNHITEVKLQSLFRMEELVKAITSKTTIPPVRDALFQFMDEVYVNTKKRSREIIGGELIWILFRRLEADVTTYLALVKSTPTTNLIGSDPKQLENERAYKRYIFGIALPFVIHYFDVYFHDDKENILRTDHQRLLFDFCEKCVEMFHSTANSSQRKIIFDVVQKIFACCIPNNPRRYPVKKEIIMFVAAGEKRIQTHTYSSREAQSNTTKLHNDDNSMSIEALSQATRKEDGQATIRLKRLRSVAGHRRDEAALVREFELFRAEFQERVSNMPELDNLVQAFSKPSDGHKYTQCLVQILRRFAHNLNNASDGSAVYARKDRVAASDIRNTVRALEVLREMILAVPEDDDNAKRQVQNELNQCKVSKMVIELICTGIDDVVKAALDLGIALLDGGNVQVQRSIYKMFRKNNTRSFFQELKRRIERSKLEIKERRDFIRRRNFRKAANEKKKAAAAIARQTSMSSTVAIKGTINDNSYNNNNNRQQQQPQHRQQQQQQQKPQQKQMLRNSGPPDDGDKEESSEHNNEDHATEEDDTFSEKGYILQILRFVQLFCEGHNLHMQNYMREQDTNLNGISINLNQEIISYLLELQKYIDHSNIDIACQVFITLTEFVQGPCEGNQVDMALHSKLFYICDEILLNPFTDALRLYYCFKLKNEVLLTLISIMEGGRQPKITESMVALLKPDRLRDQMADLEKQLSQGTRQFHQFYEETMAQEDKIFESSYPLSEHKRKKWEGKLKDMMEELGVRYHFLLSIMQDSIDRNKVKKILEDKKLVAGKAVAVIDDAAAGGNVGGGSGGGDGSSDRDDSSLNKAAHHPLKKFMSKVGIFRNKSKNQEEGDLFKRQTARIEIVRDGNIERVYFRIPQLCNWLTSRTRNNFVRQVNRNDGPPGKIDDLVTNTEYFMREMEHQSTRTAFAAALRKRWKLLKLFSFFLSVIMNLIIIATYKQVLGGNKVPIPGVALPESITINPPLVGGFRAKEWEIIITLLGALQILLTIFLLIMYIVNYGILTIVRHWRPKIPLDKRFSELPRNTTYYIKCAFYLVVYDRYIWWLAAFLVVSLLGFLVSPLFYSAQLLEIIGRSVTLWNIIAAGVKSFKVFALMGVLGLIDIYIFASGYFTWYWDYMQYEYNKNQLRAVDQQIERFPPFIMCTSIISCTVNVLSYGVRSEAFWEDFLFADPRWHRTVYDIVFFVCTIIFMLDMVFGVILDTFDQMREAQEEKNQDIHNRCFICHKESHEFDRKANEGISFQDHIKNDHNMWNYVYFLVYLYKKDRTEYTGTEQYVADKLGFHTGQPPDYSFFPMHRSMVLEESERRKEQSEGKEGSSEVEEALEVILSMIRLHVNSNNRGSNKTSGGAGGVGTFVNLGSPAAHAHLHLGGGALPGSPVAGMLGFAGGLGGGAGGAGGSSGPNTPRGSFEGSPSLLARKSSLKDLLSPRTRN